MSPTSFGHYSVVQSLGSGGMADVYLAHDPKLERHVAVKAPHAEFFNAESRARFVREAKAAAALEHYAIVPIYDYSEANGLPYMVMRYLNGGSLADRIARGPCSPAEALAVLERIAAALDYAHSRDIIHRDVKSANILFDERGNAYMADFGIAWMASAQNSELSRLTVTGTVRGTFDYISPEQARGERHLDGRSDLYSLGVVLYEMLAGDVPYHADSGILLAVQHIQAPIPDIRARRPDLPPAFQTIITRVLAKRPEDRYPSGAALVADLRRVAGGGSSGAFAPGPPVARKRPTPATPQPATGGTRAGSNNLWLAAIGVVAVVAVMLFLILNNSNAGENGVTPTITVDEPVAEPSPEATSTTAPTATVDDQPSPGVTETPPVVVPPAIPDEIVFYSSLSGDQEIYIVEADGSNRRQLTFSPGDDLYPRVSPDGQRIVFMSERDGNPEIYIMNRDGSEQRNLTNHSAIDSLPAWSPDSRYIVFQSMRNSSGDIFMMNDDGTNPVQVTNSPEREGHVSWSIDNRLVFNITQGGEIYQLYTTSIDGSDRQRLFTSSVDEWSPEWSPDGQRILFLSDRDGEDGNIFIMDRTGNNVRRVYNSPNEEWGAVWSADGSQIVFSVDTGDGHSDVYIMDAAGGQARLLIERAAYPSWAIATAGSPTPPVTENVSQEVTVSATTARTATGLNVAAGQRVAIAVSGGSWRAGTGSQWPPVGGFGDSQVASKAAFPIPDRPIMTLIGGIGGGLPFVVGGALEFTAADSGELWLGPNDDNPADNAGELRVQVTLGEVEAQIRGVNVPLTAGPQPLTGDGLVRLTTADAAHSSHYTAIFAADQSRILLSVEMGDDWQVFDADPNGGGLRRQLTSGLYDHYQADLSPDGRYFLTSANRDGDGDIYLFDATTGALVQQLTNAHALDYHPRWLPDGQSFIYSADDDGTGNDEIFLMTLDGRQTQLTNNEAFDGFATPSRDGQYIAFYSGRDGDYEIYVMDIDGSNQRRLTISSSRDASPSFSPDGRWVVFESDRGGRYEIYAVPFDGGETIRITDSDGDNYFPVISPDGKWLMFQSTRAGEMDIYRQPWKVDQ